MELPPTCRLASSISAWGEMGCWHYLWESPRKTLCGKSGLPFLTLVLESMSAHLKTSWHPWWSPRAISYRKYTLWTLESHCKVLVPVGVRCELTVVATGANGLFVTGFPPRCTLSGYYHRLLCGCSYRFLFTDTMYGLMWVWCLMLSLHWMSHRWSSFAQWQSPAYVLPVCMCWWTTYLWL